VLNNVTDVLSVVLSGTLGRSGRKRARQDVVLNAANSRVEVTALYPRGIAAGAPQRAAWPLQLAGPSRLSFYYDRERLSPVGNDATIIFRDADGAEIGLARVRR